MVETTVQNVMLNSVISMQGNIRYDEKCYNRQGDDTEIVALGLPSSKCVANALVDRRIHTTSMEPSCPCYRLRRGTRVYACGEEYAGRVNMTQARHEKRTSPCVFEEVILYFLQEIYAWWVAAIMEIKKRRDVQMVNTPVAVFVPVRHSVCSVCPLVDAALYLMSASTPVSQHRWR
jgi:hypothetical protein